MCAASLSVQSRWHCLGPDIGAGQLLSLLLQGEDQKLKDVEKRIQPPDEEGKSKPWDVHTAQVEIGKLLSERRCLVVLDDVWDPRAMNAVHLI